MIYGTFSINELQNLSMESKYVSELADRKSFNKNLNVINNLDLLKASGPDCILMVVLKNCEP